MGLCPSGGQEGRIMAGKARNWAIIYPIYLLIMSEAITLAIDTAIQYFVLGILQEALFIALRNHLHYYHHWDPGKLLALDNGSNQRDCKDVQSRCSGVKSFNLDGVAWIMWPEARSLPLSSISVRFDEEYKEIRKGIGLDRSSHPSYQCDTKNLSSQGNHRNRLKYCR